MNPELVRYLVYLLAFVAALALADGLYSLWSSLNLQRKVKVSRRLRSLRADTPQEEAVSLLREVRLSDVPAVDRLLKRVPYFSHWHRRLEQAGLDMTVARFLAMQLALGLVTAVLLARFTPAHPLLVLGIAAVLGIGLPHLHVQQARTQRLKRFTELLPDTMDYIARSMRAGNPFTASLKNASGEMPEPIAGELRTCFEEMNFGVDLEQSLRHLGERNGSEELRYFITAVLIQRTTGGNLAEVLGRIAAVMRSRAAMVREVAAISAEMNYSAKVLIALPFAMALMLSVLNPSYLHVLIEHRIGLYLIGAQLGLMAMGWYVIRQMIHFRI
ncbi:MAG: tight adherence protein [Moraxellaceae bacterium]|nr:tight adherence protein [Moraxellaceae bacterium]